MKLYIIAGEPSGDLHGSNLLRELKNMHPGLQARGMGGDQLQQQGMDLLIHCREMNFMGFVEVVKHLPAILTNMKRIKADILQYRPDAVILIDYPGFNLRMAEFCKAQGIKVIYYISPQIWAWKTSRVKKIRAFVDRMITILPFEQEFYRSHGVEVAYAGHPLLDAMKDLPEDQEFRRMNGLDERHIIAVLPGSRKMEIRQMLPVMLETIAKHMDKYQFVIAGAPSMEPEFYHRFGIPPQVKLVQGQTYPLLQHACAALVTSGTATLETALFNVPQVVCYRGNKISYHIARRLVKVNYISLVNLILDKPAVKELIQHDLTPANLEKEFMNITGQGREAMFRDYAILKEKLGNSGASRKAAEVVSALLA